MKISDKITFYSNIMPLPFFSESVSFPVCVCVYWDPNWDFLFQIGITPTEPQLNSKVGFDTKMTVDPYPPATRHHYTNSMPSISQLFLTRL